MFHHSTGGNPTKLVAQKLAPAWLLMLLDGEVFCATVRELQHRLSRIGLEYKIWTYTCGDVINVA